MSDMEPPAHTQGEGIVTSPRQPREGTARLGKELYERDIQGQVGVTLDVHDLTVTWGGRSRPIKADATGSTPLASGHAARWAQLEHRSRAAEANMSYRPRDSA